MVLGKFLPPHMGHVYLVEFARQWVEELTVVVGTLEREPIPGALRHQWMQELFPHERVRVVHLSDENPQEPHEHPEFWRIWRESLTRILPGPADLVFASETYGHRLAQELGARFVPADLARGAVPVSGTAIREDPMTHWAYIPECVRPYFLRRVCIAGPESSGKTTLASALADHYATTWVPEYARGFIEEMGDPSGVEDMVSIARGQVASERALERRATRVLFSDTDALATTLWSDFFFEDAPAIIDELARSQRYDLTLLLAPDVPYVEDPVRYMPERRQEFFERMQRALSDAGRQVVVLDGSFEARTERALEAVDELLARPGMRAHEEAGR